MQATDLRNKLREIRYTCQMNQLYHQARQSWWGAWDKGVKIAVAVLAIFALGAVFFPESCKWLEIVAAMLATLAAIILNVLPVGEWGAFAAELFRAWSDLRVCAEQLQIKAEELSEAEPVHPLLIDRYSELLGKLHMLNALEPKPNEPLLLRCQHMVNEMEYGPGIRSIKDVQKERQKREASAT